MTEQYFVTWRFADGTTERKPATEVEFIVLRQLLACAAAGDPGPLNAELQRRVALDVSVQILEQTVVREQAVRVTLEQTVTREQAARETLEQTVMQEHAVDHAARVAGGKAAAKTKLLKRDARVALIRDRFDRQPDREACKGLRVEVETLLLDQLHEPPVNHSYQIDEICEALIFVT